MQRRIRAATLTDRYGTAYQAPTIRTLDLSNLSGGLNTWELEYKLKTTQSPDLLNLYWKDGALSSRMGQEYVFEQAADTAYNEMNGVVQYGDFVACYSKEWIDGYVIAHKGTKLYKINLMNGEHDELYDGLSGRKGSFFVFDDSLYYLGGNKYIKITKDSEASDVEPYTPVVVMNREPDGSGGMGYQPENRIAAGKEIWFTADGTTKKYVLPYKELDENEVTVTYIVPSTMVEQTLAEDIDFTVDRAEGTITFNTAPAQATPLVVNNVKVVCYKGDETSMNNILTCTCSAVYGASNDMVIVVGGCESQPNAYFWSGSHDYADAGYFPVDYYNLAGVSNEPITGFAKQQSMLVIFKPHSIGKTTLGDPETIGGRIYLTMPYTPVNDTIGSDLPGSIKLIENNIVFASSEGGAYVLLDTSSSGENNIKSLSRNINGDGKTKGFLFDARQVDTRDVTSYDDGERYWLVANGNAYLWDYTIKGYMGNEENLSWFLFDNINALGWHSINDDAYYFTENGSLSKFSQAYADYGNAFKRRYVFAAQYFGTYEVLKDVMKVIFSVRSDTDTTMDITYRTDYELRKDKTPIRAWGYRLSPRNLAHRSLKPIIFAGTAVRIPRCFHVRHFQMILENNEIYTDMSVISAQILYRYVREDR